MIPGSETYPFLPTNPAAGPLGLMPLLPLRLELPPQSIAVLGLLDTASAVNVLPYRCRLATRRGLGPANHERSVDWQFGVGAGTWFGRLRNCRPVSACSTGICMGASEHHSLDLGSAQLFRRIQCLLFARFGDLRSEAEITKSLFTGTLVTSGECRGVGTCVIDCGQK